ncbi:MAG: gluconate 2-dehydrogenase subunit 3 family protein [Myxococcota bacterium]|nr:gluconate 2-dehydrogenase subunit 3 family protein [Myxococcota bacterium]
MRETTDHPRGPPPRKVPRRRVLKAALAVGLLVGGSAMALARTRGYVVAPGRKLDALTPWQFVVVQHAARRIVAPDRDGDASIPTADDLDVAAFVDGWLARLPQRMRRDLGRFLAYIEHVAPVGAGFEARFTRLGSGEQDRVLASVEASTSDLLRAGFDGLRSLVFLGYYRDPRTWRVVGYDGPLVDRPRSGWR